MGTLKPWTDNRRGDEHGMVARVGVRGGEGESDFAADIYVSGACARVRVCVCVCVRVCVCVCVCGCEIICGAPTTRG